MKSSYYGLYALYTYHYDTSGSDLIITGDEDDFVILKRGDDTVRTNGGNDRVYAYQGDMYIDTGVGDDYVFKQGSGTSKIVTGEGNDRVYTYNNINEIDTGTGNDVIYSYKSTNTIHAGDGRDIIYSYYGDYQVNAGSGNDVVYAYFSEVDLVTDDGDDYVLLYKSTGTVDTGQGNDKVYSYYESNEIETNDGNDYVMSYFANDTIQTGAGNDFILLYHGASSVDAGSGSDRIIGYFGDYTITYSLAENINAQDAYRLGTGHDVLKLVVTYEQSVESWFVEAMNAFQVYLDTSTSVHQTFDFSTFDKNGEYFNLIVSGIDQLDLIVTGQPEVPNVELLIGTKEADEITTSAASDIVLAREGSDIISTALGDDTIQSISGDNQIYTGSGDDIVTTGFGHDTISLGNENDFVLAGYGRDTIQGDSGHDTLFGEQGDDTIKGGAGNDLLIGGEGADFLEGGEGKDAFKYLDVTDSTTSVFDTIVDFESGLDGIDFRGLFNERLTDENVDDYVVLTNQGGYYSVTITTDDDFYLEVNTATLTFDDFITHTNCPGCSGAIAAAGDTFTMNLPDEVARTDLSNSDFMVEAGTLEVFGDENSFELADSGRALAYGDDNEMIGDYANNHLKILGNDNKASTSLGDDYVFIDGENNEIDTANHNDQLIVDGRWNKAELGTGDDIASVAGSANQVWTEDGNDKVAVTGHNHNIDLGRGNDELDVEGTFNYIRLGSGQDKVTVDGSSMRITGHFGDKTLYVSGMNHDIELVRSNDTIQATGDRNEFYLNGGDDSITLGEGISNYINTGSGDDTVRLEGVSRSDVFAGSGDDLITGFGDRLTIDVGSGNDTVQLNEGKQTVNYHYNENKTSLNTIQLGEGADTLNLFFTEREVADIIQNLDEYETISDWKSSVIEKASGAVTERIDFSDLGFGLVAEQIETIQLNIQANTDLTVEDDYTQFTVGSSNYVYILENDTTLEDRELSVLNVLGQESHTSSFSLESGMKAYYNTSNERFFLHGNQGLEFLGAGDVIQDSFTYTVTDGAETDTATVYIDIVGVNDKATAFDDAFSYQEDQDITGSLLRDNGFGEDYDIDRTDTISVYSFNGHVLTSDNTTLTLASGALVDISKSGEFTLRSNNAYDYLSVGEQIVETYQYRIVDQHGLESESATAYFTITGKNNAPVSLDDKFTINESTVLRGNLFEDNGFGKDFDVDDTELSLNSFNGQAIQGETLLTLASGATILLDTNGDFVFDTKESYIGLTDGEIIQEKFSYTTTDGTITSADTEFAIDIYGKNTDSPLPSLTVNNATVTEGSVGESRWLEFTLELSRPAETPITLDYTMAGLTASAVLDADVSLEMGTVIFDANERVKTIRVEVYGDNKVETDETVMLKLLNLNGAEFINDSAIGTILNDDEVSGDTNALEVPIFNSKANSEYTLYLDFDGELVKDSAWRSYDIEATPFSDDNDLTNFNATELAMIEEIWARVAEDYAPFNINVTTDRAAYDATPIDQKSHIVITENNDWYSSSFTWGVAYGNSFGSSRENAKVSWVFSEKVTTADSIADVISHEAGHTFGTGHDFSNGFGTGPMSWAPIMGTNFNKTITHWSDWSYRDDRVKDDIEQIRNDVGFREDKVGDTFLDSVLLHLDEGLAAESIIETRNDIDMYRFDATGAFKLNINPIEKGANLDILANLYNEAGDLIISSNPLDELFAEVAHTSSEEATFYLAISGTGRGDPLDGGYSDYGSLGYYQIEFQSLEDESIMPQLDESDLL